VFKVLVILCVGLVSSSAHSQIKGAVQWRTAIVAGCMGASKLEGGVKLSTLPPAATTRYLDICSVAALEDISQSTIPEQSLYDRLVKAFALSCAAGTKQLLMPVASPDDILLCAKYAINLYQSLLPGVPD